MSDEVEWDGQTLIGWVSIGGAATMVKADRETIHCHAAGFNDAVSWEIERHRFEIFQKLKPHLMKGTRIPA
jgi:hypothetical protein